MGILSRLFGAKPPAAPASTTAATKPVADVYLGLRNKVLELRPEMIGATATAPLALLMENVQSNVPVTLASFADGTTSLYFGNGGGILGAGQKHHSVADASKAFLKMADEQFASTMTPTSEVPLPSPGQVRFYLRYADRVLTADAIENDLGFNRHPLSPLFHAGHRVIAQMRLHTQR